MFVRSEVYKEMNGLDGDFFAHMEEIDFCWRLKNAGHKIYYCPESVVYHIGGGTLPKKNSRKTYLNIRNNIIMLFKNVQQHRLWKVYFTRLGMDFLASLKFFIDGGFSDFWAVVKAHFYVIRRFRYFRKKREKVEHRKVSHIYWGSIVRDHYLKGIKAFPELDPSKFTK